MNADAAPYAASRRMQRVKRSGTDAEQQIERVLIAGGIQIQTQVKMHGCTPDIICVEERTAVFIDGDFWHGRLALERGARYFRKSFGQHCRKFWTQKIAANIERDQRLNHLLRRHGWAVIRLWEKDVLQESKNSFAIMFSKLAKRRKAIAKRRKGAV